MSQPIIQSMAKCPWVLLLANRVACARRTRHINVTTVTLSLSSWAAPALKMRVRVPLWPLDYKYILYVCLCVYRWTFWRANCSYLAVNLSLLVSSLLSLASSETRCSYACHLFVTLLPALLLSRLIITRLCVFLYFQGEFANSNSVDA